MVGNRRAGATAVADHVTAPSFTSVDKTGMALLFNDSCPSPSSTNRMTCSVVTSEADGRTAEDSRAARAMDWNENVVTMRDRTRAMPMPQAAMVVRMLLVRTITCLTTRPFIRKRKNTLARCFPGRQGTNHASHGVPARSMLSWQSPHTFNCLSHPCVNESCSKTVFSNVSGSSPSRPPGQESLVP